MRKALVAVAVCTALGAGARAKDTSIKFAPPAYPMTNMVSNDAIDGTGFDFMQMSGNGFNLSCATLGKGTVDRYWEAGGFLGSMAGQLIYGSLDTGPGSDPFRLYGFGTQFPISWYFDPLSHDDDDTSLPMYFGIHAGTMQMFGSMSYETKMLDHYDRYTIGPPVNYTYYVPVYEDVTATQHLSLLQVQVGWQFGVQFGMNLGEHLKIIPYVDVSQDVYNYSSIDTYTSWSRYSGYDSPPDSTSTSGNLGALPIAMSPGFDIILRKIGLSLGAAYQSTKQAGGSLKQINLHLRWSKKFRSICGI